MITFPKEDIRMESEGDRLLRELETQHGIRSAEDFDRWWREAKGDWEREIALLKSQLIQAHHLNNMKMEEFMQQFTMECVKVKDVDGKDRVLPEE